jgi:hypothetical protein
MDNIKSGESKLTGLTIGHIILDILNELELNLKFCVDVGTDKWSVMTSKNIGTITTILKECPMAV